MRGEKLFNGDISIIYPACLIRHCHNNHDNWLTTVVNIRILKPKYVLGSVVMDEAQVGFLQFLVSCKCVVCAYLQSPDMSKTVWCFFRFLRFMSLQCFVTTTRAALTAHYSINPRLGLSLTHLPPSEDRRFRQTWVGLDIRKKECFHVPMWSLQMGPGTWEWNIV